MSGWQDWRQYTRGISREIVLFAAVGTVGFVVDACILTLLVTGVGWGVFESRPLSFLVAVSLTWFLNRVSTFRHRAGPNRRQEYLRYMAVGTLGALLNFSVYAAVLLSIPTLVQWPAVALAAGSLTAMAFNFLGSRAFAFDRRLGRGLDVTVLRGLRRVVPDGAAERLTLADDDLHGQP
jgi:putative flippase GtrA